MQIVCEGTLVVFEKQFAADNSAATLDLTEERLESAILGQVVPLD